MTVPLPSGPGLIIKTLTTETAAVVFRLPSAADCSFVLILFGCISADSLARNARPMGVFHPHTPTFF